MPPKKASHPPSKTLFEISILQSRDTSIHQRVRGAPTLNRHASGETMGKSINEVAHADIQREIERFCVGRPPHQNGNRLKEEFNQLMHWAVKHGYRTTPYRCFGAPKRVSQANLILSQALVEAVLLDVDKAHTADLVVRIAVRAMALLGLSLAEATEFSLSRINMDRWEYVQTDVRGHLRMIPVSRPMQALLRAAIARPEGLVVEQGGWINRRRLTKVVLEAGKRCGLANLTPSILTRTAIRGRRA